MTKMAEDPPRADPCDDTAILRIYLHWAESPQAVLTAPHGTPALGHIHRRDTGEWELVFSIDRGIMRRQRHFITICADRPRPDRWWIGRLAPGIWDAPRSIHVPGQIHAFVTLVNAPEPAPWAPTAP